MLLRCCTALSWVDLIFSQLQTFPVSPTAQDESPMFHDLFFWDQVLSKIEISVQKGQVLRVRREWVRLGRAEQMTRVVGEVWVLDEGWVIGEPTWPVGAYDWGLVTDALHDRWVTKARCTTHSLHTSLSLSFHLMSTESHIAAVPLEARRFIKHRSACVNVYLLWEQVAEVTSLVFIRYLCQWGVIVNRFFSELSPVANSPKFANKNSFV